MVRMRFNLCVIAVTFVHAINDEQKCPSGVGHSKKTEWVALLADLAVFQMIA